jgi:hypothetical protein
MNPRTPELKPETIPICFWGVICDNDVDSIVPFQDKMEAYIFARGSARLRIIHLREVREEEK